MVSHGFSEDVAFAKSALATLPTDWEGKAAILELKAANNNWRQMEWWAFYFEYLCFPRLMHEFTIPGDRFASVTFDLKRSVNWDLKSKAIKSDDKRAILNDRAAMEESIRRYGEHGAIIALCDVEYDDDNRTFQKWHTELKGGMSAYEQTRIKRTAVSRYRKTRAHLMELLLLRFDADALP
jgi:hypothetical protein